MKMEQLNNVPCDYSNLGFRWAKYCLCYIFCMFICLHRVKMPDLFDHVEKLGVSYTIFSTKWFICLFIDVLPIEVRNITKCLQSLTHSCPQTNAMLCKWAEGLEQAGHNSTGQVSKKMAKKVASQREKVLSNIGQQKSEFFFLFESHGIFKCIN